MKKDKSRVWLCKIPQGTNVMLRDLALVLGNNAHSTVCTWNKELFPATQGTEHRRGGGVCSLWHWSGIAADLRAGWKREGKYM